MRAALLGGALLAGCAREPGVNRSTLAFDGDPPVNLLILSLDTTRRDAIGRYAPGDSLTPFLDGLLDAGVALDDFTSCSNWTVASAGCVLSGSSDVLRAADRGMVPFYAGGKPVPFPGEGDAGGPTPFLATWLGEAGFRSALVTGNPFLGPQGGNDQGYDRVELRGPGGDVFETAFDVVPRGREPWLLHVHLMEPHLSYDAPRAWVDLEGLPPLTVDLDLWTWEAHGAAAQAIAADPPVWSQEQIDAVIAHLRARYEAEVRYADHLLAEGWARLEDEGLLDRTLVLFFTDHGEAFWEHGVSAHAHHLFREENDAVAFFWARDLQGGAFSGPVEGPDLAPTVMQVFGLPIPPEMTGTPLGHAPDDRVRHAFADTLLGPVHSARRGPHKLVYAWRTGRLHAFDLDADPQERTNLVDAGPLGPEHLALWDAMLPRIEAAAPAVADDPRGWTPVWPEGVPAGDVP